jgi:hypothetical protein
MCLLAIVFLVDNAPVVVGAVPPVRERPDAATAYSTSPVRNCHGRLPISNTIRTPRRWRRLPAGIHAPPIVMSTSLIAGTDRQYAIAAHECRFS